MLADPTASEHIKAIAALAAADPHLYKVTATHQPSSRPARGAWRRTVLTRDLLTRRLGVEATHEVSERVGSSRKPVRIWLTSSAGSDSP
jgi:hypothetical protein